MRGQRFGGRQLREENTLPVHIVSCTFLVVETVHATSGFSGLLRRYDVD
jgi:hypothetical protein